MIVRAAGRALDPQDPQDPVVGGGMGMRYIIKGSTIVEHGSLLIGFCIPSLLTQPCYR